MTKYDELLALFKSEIESTLGYLEYSHQKIQSLPSDPHLSSSDKWMQVRELRNKIAHEYSRSDLKITFEDVKSYTPFVLAELKKVLR